MSDEVLFPADQHADFRGDSLELTWRGPYRWFGTGDESICAGPCAETSGVYVWTVPVGDTHRVFYVGQTEAGFAARHHEHFAMYFKGAYNIYSPQSFRRGELELIYRGYNYRHPAWKLAPAFFENFPCLVERLVEHLAMMRMFVAELPQDCRLQRRIETALMQNIYGSEPPAGQFLEPGLKLEPRYPNEVPIRIAQGPIGLLEGVPARFEA